MHSMLLLILVLSVALFSTESRYYSYIDYLVQFNKSLDRLSDLERVDRYAARDNYISEHNKCHYKSKASSNSCFALKHTMFSDWTLAELDLFFHDQTNDSSETQPPQFPEIGFNPGYNPRETPTDVSQLLPVHLNWASSDNPFGHTIVSPIRDQGSCGACWAFVSISTVEASIRFTAELIARKGTQNLTIGLPTDFVDPIFLPNSTKFDRGLFGEIDENNVAPRDNEDEEADEQQQQLGEHTSKFVYLSPQQLIDCDIGDGNKGCSGGRPNNAFNYIRSNGVTSWDRYPFFGEEGQCAVDSAQSIGFIRGWAALRGANEQNLMIALHRYGPIAVGICGTDEAFMLYSSGIFDSATCCTAQNHAITLVGYGVDEVSSTPYWFAANSWGTSWGEKGFIKLLRSYVLVAMLFRTSSPNSAGMCGLAIQPTLPYGGFVSNVASNRFHDWKGYASYWWWVICREINALYYQITIIFHSQLQTILLSMSVSLGIIATCGIVYLNCLDCVEIVSRRYRSPSNRSVPTSNVPDNGSRPVEYSALELIGSNPIYHSVYEQSPFHVLSVTQQQLDSFYINPDAAEATLVSTAGSEIDLTSSVVDEEQIRLLHTNYSHPQYGAVLPQ